MLPKTFTEYFKNIDEGERQYVIQELLLLISSENSDSGVAEGQAEAQASHRVCCAHCSSTDVRANGKYKDVQRYYCKTCSTYFRETTGKMSFGLKKGQLLKTYLYHMLMGLSIAKCAKATGICIQTSFDWRHKILSAFNQTVPEGFEGIVESDDIFFLESDKGSRTMSRVPRKRGSKATKRGISNEQVAVVVTCDRSDNKELRVATKGRISKKDLEKVFEDKLDKAETLCTDTHRSYTAFAKSIELDHQKFNVSKGQRVKNKIYHVQNVNNTAKRLRQWMKPFNGVATKYLQNYMNWFMILERIKNNREQLKAFAFYAFAGQSAWETWRNIHNSVIL
jgi:transposase-like protein